MGQVPDIFRAYDIRGNTEDELTPEVMERIGRAYGSHVHADCEADSVVVGRDARLSSEELHEAFLEGLARTPLDEIVDLGLTAFGVVLYTAWADDHECAYVTASHLPPEWNGVKFYHPTGVGFMDENVAVQRRFEAHDFADGVTGIIASDNRPEYLAYVAHAVGTVGMDLLLDCGNGVAGITAPELFERLDCDVSTLFEEPDGRFPNRESDITEESVSRLREEAGDHDLGIAYDGDSDRCALVAPSGRLLSADETAYLVLDQYLEDHSGETVVANVECSRMIEAVAERHDCEVERVRVGHTYLYDAVLEHDAVFGVEKAGHFAVPEVFPLDDAVAASAFFAAQLADVDIEEAVAAIPEYHNARTAFECPDDRKFDVVDGLQQELSAEFDRTNTKDGVRVDLDDGWILIRASNTSPKIRLTVEAESAEALERLHDRFSERLEAAL